MSRVKKQISDINLDKIGGRIAYIRIVNNLTMAEFSEITGLSTGNLSGLESHKYEPSFQTIVKILEIYSVNPEWFLFGKGDPLKGENSNGPIQLADDPEISNLLTMTRTILKSETEYSHSLSANIRSFHHSVETDQRLKKMEDEISEIKKRFESDRRQEIRRQKKELFEGPERRVNPDRRKYDANQDGVQVET